MDEKPFVIDNCLLKQAILGGTYCEKIPLRKCPGFLYDSGAEQIERAFLEYCYSEIFNIRRFPGFETYLVNSSFHCKGLIENNEIDEEDITEACNQLKKLYEYTQKRLSLKEIPLHRTLRDFEIKVLAKQSGEEIFLPANILSCYSYNNAYSGYDGDVVINRNVPAESIVMIDSWTAYSNIDNCTHKIYTGEGEVWVLNKDRFGRIPIKRAWIDDSKNKIYSVKGSIEAHEVEWFINRDDGKSLIQNRTLPIRPCETGWLTRILIQRNMKKIEKFYKE